MANTTWLDHMSAAGERDRVRQEAAGEVLALWGRRLLMAATFFVLFVGLDPISRTNEGAAAGSLVRQVSFLALAVVASPLLVMRWQRTLRLLVRAWPLLLVFAAIASTSFWSQFPSVTIRRLVPLAIMFVVALALAATLRSPRDYLPPLAAGFAVILVVDLILAFAAPGLAYDALGLAGLHPSKNVAGGAGQMMAITFAAALLAVRSPVGFWALVALLLLSLVFLWLTESKTALGLTGLSIFVVLPALWLAHRGPVFTLAFFVGIAVAVGGVLFATGTLDLTGADWALITTGDASFTNRDDIWRASVQIVAERPFLGHGFGAMWSMMPVFHPLNAYIGFWTDSPETLLILNQSHNGYLDILIHGGVYLAFVVAIFVMKTMGDVVAGFGSGTQDRWASAGNAFVGTILIGVLLSNLLESTLFFPDGLLGQILILVVVGHAGWRMREA